MAIKREKIKAQIENLEKNLDNAAAYLKKNVNVRGISQFHLDDWNGKSGHPRWMKNIMIPRTKKALDNMVKSLELIEYKNKDKLSPKQRRALNARENSSP